jgi:hypothetical protein
MNPGEFLVKRKTHLVFVSLLLMVLAVSTIMGFMAGQTLRGATWRAISEIRPMEYILFAGFWYDCAVRRSKEGWGSSLTTLNLSRPNHQK